MPTRTPTTHLTGIGHCPATLASELVVGDTLLWSYGYRSTITDITQPSPKTLLVTFARDGQSHTRQMRTTSVWATQRALDAAVAEARAQCCP